MFRSIRNAAGIHMSTFKEGGASEADVKMDDLDPANQDEPGPGWTPGPVSWEKIRGVETPA